MNYVQSKPVCFGKSSFQIQKGGTICMCGQGLKTSDTKIVELIFWEESTHPSPHSTH